MKEKQEPRITVIVPVYNSERYIQKCLESLLVQASDKFALLVIDDGSSDGSRKQMEVTLQNAKISYCIEAQEHRGVSAARNRGLALAKTEYVMFLDSDDRLEADAIAVLDEQLNKGSPDVIVYGLSHMLGDEIGKTVCAKKVLKLQSQQEIREHMVQLWDSGLMYSSCNKLLRLEMLRKHDICFPEMSFGEDFALCRDVLCRCERLTVLNRSLYRYTTHTGGSLSTIFRPDLFQIRRREHECFWEYFCSLGLLSEQAEEFLARRHIERMVGCVENICSPQCALGVLQRVQGIREMLEDRWTGICAQKAKLKSLRMKILVFPMKKRWCRITLAAGYMMSFCKNRLPQVFTWLKITR